MLVLDAWLFEYLVLVYFSRWRDVRVCSLLFAALLSLVTHVYFHQDLDVMLVLNGVSETSLQLTFLIQISIIGRAVGRKVKVRSIARLTLAAEVLVLLGWLHVLVSILEASAFDRKCTGICIAHFRGGLPVLLLVSVMWLATRV
ncbi:hypothetical protein PF003_g12771 [Phytophthora fragariae]|nr:hypothetical protein PF003_g12771 [Phytophthora fragariae]